MTRQVRRGGTWRLTLFSNGRSAYRNAWAPRGLNGSTGFRVVCLSQGVKPAPVVSRGGAWCNSFSWKMRSKARDYCRAHRADDIDGFRVVCLPREVAPRRAVLRGGAWDSLPPGRPASPRSAHRGIDLPGYADDYIGFRVICLPPEVTP